ncbi:MAG: dTDP-4-dehydrorhamnose 3,5-epimerase family protein [Deltaproteobacteria bacterium]|nr:dTDP-4-dehydrorhamnose 3,5-epimerase family protein [Deltaproteobacteria bacterium]MBW2051221.1 dTDP-4-dehydrorhamnose 3,5-epimerase family protein [Deltaproteobacteria bacterium]MBW2139862.1 dTDP-4-dehydrorhamnose 3,5-epimerase family protein [Deltaproteobacteria bacterium]MBW2322026.1 dTDP-4-dehydrorhamnose 3,5-epimerase family protein [Deltaproteobacteria bacterium]
MELIDGIETKELRVIPDERGRLMEMLRADDPIFEKFGQVYLSTTYPGVVKGWHSHKLQSDYVICVRGMIKLVIHDPRDDSPTRGMVNEFFIGEHNPMLIKIPPGLHHGWKCISETEAYIINVPTMVYNYENPDEYRIDPHENDIPYDWTSRDG